MMVFNGYPSKYRCPAGGAHDLANSPSYSMTFTNDAMPTRRGQDGGDWRYCSECQCMVFTRHRQHHRRCDSLRRDRRESPRPAGAPPSTGGIAFSGQAAVMISHRFGWRPVHHPGFVLACWHLPVGAAPRLQDLLYFDPGTRTLDSGCFGIGSQEPLRLRVSGNSQSRSATTPKPAYFGCRDRDDGC